jgi:hypothetical protein
MSSHEIVTAGSGKMKYAEYLPEKDAQMLGLT